MPPLKILVVEDSASSRMLLVELLKQMQHRVVSARDGREGVDAAFVDRFDLVLMDLRMPVMDGLSATKIIRSFGPSARTSRRVPIVAVSSGSPGVSYDHCADSGLTAFLCKPVDQPRLEQVIRQVFSAAWTQDQPRRLIAV
jgi:CheY-like chemotaxis protein